MNANLVNLLDLILGRMTMTKHIWIIEKYNPSKQDWFPVAGVSFKTKKEAERWLEYEYNCVDNDIESGILGTEVKYRPSKYNSGE